MDHSQSNLKLASLETQQLFKNMAINEDTKTAAGFEAAEAASALTRALASPCIKIADGYLLPFLAEPLCADSRRAACKRCGHAAPCSSRAWQPVLGSQVLADGPLLSPIPLLPPGPREPLSRLLIFCRRPRQPHLLQRNKKRSNIAENADS
jgi:hypothetical protein